MLYENVYFLEQIGTMYTKCSQKRNFVFSQKRKEKISYKPCVSHRSEEEEMIQKLGENGERRRKRK